MTSEEYFQTVIKEYNADFFVMPEYKIVFGKNINDEYKTILNIHNLLKLHIAVSDIIEIVHKDYQWCYAFSYDDSQLDDNLQFLRFFDFPFITK